MPIALFRARGSKDAPSGGDELASGIWPSVSGAVAQSRAVDVVANNLANADTLGFKKDAPTFREYLSSIERERAALDVPKGPFRDKDFFPIDGRDQSFVVVDGTYTDFKQGDLRVTSSPLDIALDGKGFLEVSTPSGVRYTRQGSLKMATDGRLVTLEGYPVLASQPGGLANAPSATTAVQPGQGGLPTQGGVAAEPYPTPEIQARYIYLRDLGGNISVTETGDVYAGENRVAGLSVVEFFDPARLRKSGGQLFENPDPANVATGPNRTRIHQGVLETSNVNPVQEMTDLIKAHRLFEHDLKAMKTYDQLLEKEANQLGKI